MHHYILVHGVTKASLFGYQTTLVGVLMLINVEENQLCNIHPSFQSTTTIVSNELNHQQMPLPTRLYVEATDHSQAISGLWTL